MTALKLLGQLLLAFFILLLLSLAWLWPYNKYSQPLTPAFAVERVFDQPLISGNESPRLASVQETGEGDADYLNVNGPTLIRVPSWLENPLGKYYLYFAHHKGDHIRLAYADNLTGPWTIYEPGALELDHSLFPTELGQPPELGAALGSLWDNYSIYVARDLFLLLYRAAVADPAERKRRGFSAATNAKPHIASPEIFVDQQQQRILMYYHGLHEDGGQYTRVAVSVDGLHFAPRPQLIRNNYLRLFQRDDYYYALTMPGVLYRSRDPLIGFEPRQHNLFEHNMRHAGLLLEEDRLYVFWSRVGDNPESILLSEIDLTSPNWDDWQASAPQIVLRPELEWEGAKLPPLASMRGELNLAARELRDPFVFVDEDGSRYLLYTGAAEQGIGLARLIDLRR